MIRALSLLCFLWSIVLPRPAPACQCETLFSTCNEVAESDLVFIGTVQSIDPISLSLWNLTSPVSVRLLNDAYIDAQKHPTAAALARFKDTYSKTFPDLAAAEKRQVQGAKTVSDVTSLFYSALDRGMRVRFKVKTVFKRGDDDDSPKDAAPKDHKAKDDDDDDKKSQDSLDVWTPFGDCGFDFQIGETYLVYANDDEASNVLSTGSCTRTRRLSDAGGDLAYLFFYKDHREESSRLEGFTTTNELYELDLDPTHDPETIQPAVAGVIVELQSDRLTRYAESDRNGRFVFDGLREGDYQVSGFAQRYPVDTRLLVGPRPLHIDPKSCARQVLVLPKLVLPHKEGK